MEVMLDATSVLGASHDVAKENGLADMGTGRLSPELNRLYAAPLPASRKGALYNAFSYPTKISPEAIALFLAVHTKPGDTVLDTFGGSGTTGLAALLCDRPTATMREMAANAGVEPAWGPRNAVIQEVGALGSFVAAGLCSPPDPAAFDAAVASLLDRVERDLEGLYSARDPEGNLGTIRHVIWTEFLVCPGCRAETSFWRAAVRFSPLRMLDAFRCEHCGHEAPMDTVERATETVYDPLLQEDVPSRKRRPARVHGVTNGRNWQRDALEDDERRISEISRLPMPAGAPVSRIAWGELFRSGYHTGITHLHHFYTRRNFLALAKLWQAADGGDESLRNALKLLILSYNGPHATMMTRVVVKKDQRDFVLTGAQSGVLYVSGLPVEKNIFEGLRRKAKTIRDAFTLVHGSRSSVRVVRGSSTHLDLPDASVSYVFTDPPFGDYIPYAEVNQISEAWLGKLTDRSEEIVISPSGGKSVETYGRMMADVFAEIARVLKPEGKATVVFHSAKADVWQALARAYSQAGLSVEATSVLDKLQDSFKQVVSTVAVKGEPLLLLRKAGGSPTEAPETTASILADVLQGISPEATASVAKERSAERLFSLFVGRCLAAGVPVHMDADAFYAEVRRRQAAA
ncbi:DNA methyltransferase [Teichococcus cervicalis]|uniref:DNA methyltransferase n=1 Tax=Teichococcus cervicalis TaxID=204525 RepID=UPI0036D225F1